MSRIFGYPAVATVFVLLASAASAPSGIATRQTTAWRAGSFHVDRSGVVARSDLLLLKPNLAPEQFLPLGNGRLGTAIWAADGLTAQINRVDTFPNGSQVGTVRLPGLLSLTRAPGYRGRLDLYNGLLVQTADGMTATAYVRTDKDEFVIDVRGANPAQTETATITLPSARHAVATARRGIATLSEVWRDDHRLGGSGRRFGTLAALTAGARAVKAEVLRPNQIEVRFRPRHDGTFRVVVAAPHWAGGNAEAAARSYLAGDADVSPARLAARTRSWWNGYWGRVGMLKLSSPDGEAQYVENLRALDLFTQAASSGSAWPASHGGVANLFAFYGDGGAWCTHCYWEWNLRMAVAANLGAGAFRENDPYFDLYVSNLRHIEAWTRSQMGGRPGACVPEVVSYNGNGYYDGTPKEAKLYASCEANTPPYYPSRILTTGTEVALWIWRQYRYTLDRRFLERGYPLIASAARFLLAYAQLGSDGKLHTFPSNAHETQLDTRDPITDITAMRALFPVVVKAAALVGKDQALVRTVQKAEKRLLPLPTATHDGKVVYRFSDQPLSVNNHNDENLTLEPVWPYELIHDSDGKSAKIAINSYWERPFVLLTLWSPDSIDAARLGLSHQVATDLATGTAKFQTFISGFGVGAGPDPYIEWNAIVATTLQDALVQADNGILEVAPGWPTSWDADGTVFIPGRNKVDVQYHHGRLTMVAVEAGSTGRLLVRNPWPGRRVEVVSGRDLTSVVVPARRSKLFRLPLVSGSDYVIQTADHPVRKLPFATVTGSRVRRPRHFEGRMLGLG